MRKRIQLGILGSVLIATTAPQQQGSDWTKDFVVDPTEFASTGRNPFFSLEPGDQIVLVHDKEQLTITVLPKTRTVDGVETRVIEERETNSGALVEVSLNYYAISR